MAGAFWEREWMSRAAAKVSDELVATVLRISEIVASVDFSVVGWGWIQGAGDGGARDKMDWYSWREGATEKWVSRWEWMRVRRVVRWMFTCADQCEAWVLQGQVLGEVLDVTEA